MNFNEDIFNEIMLNLDLEISKTLNDTDRLRLELVKLWFCFVKENPEDERVFHVWSSQYWGELLSKTSYPFPEIESVVTNIKKRSEGEKKKNLYLAFEATNLKLLESIVYIPDSWYLVDEKNKTYLVNINEVFQQVVFPRIINEGEKVILVKDDKGEIRVLLDNMLDIELRAA